MLLSLRYIDHKGERHELQVPFAEMIQWYCAVRQIVTDLKISPPFQGELPVEPPRRGKPPQKP